MDNVKAIKNLAGEINNLLKVDYQQLQSFYDLSLWQVGESKMIGQTINTKVVNNKNHQRFITQIPPLASFDTHWHDCSEICTILSGVLKDSLTGMQWSINQQAVFSKGQKHTPFNPSKENWLYITVDFYK